MRKKVNLWTKWKITRAGFFAGRISKKALAGKKLSKAETSEICQAMHEQLPKRLKRKNGAFGACRRSPSVPRSAPSKG